MFVVDASEVIRTFTLLPDRLAKKVVRKALRDACKVLAKEIKARVPVESGATRRSIKVRATKRSRKGFGCNVIVGGEVVGAVQTNWGNKRTAAQHWANAAFEAAAPQAEALLMSELRAGIQRELASLNKSA